jgi:DNA-binding transcriptional ArsR family regulator
MRRRNDDMRALDVIRERETAATLLQPLRQQILEGLREPESASTVARRLGLPRQKVNYHLRELERGGFVELVEERRRGNCTERLVKATARSYLISPEALGALGSDPERIRDRLSAAYLVATAGQAVRDVGELEARADEAGKRLATLTLTSEVRFASAETRTAFAEELATTLARLSAKYHDETAPRGRRFRFFVGGYPVPSERGRREGTESRETRPVTGRRGETA